VVALTVPYGAQARALASLRGALQADSILLDVTVPLASAVGGPSTQLLAPWAGSAAEQASRLVGDNVAVCAAFHHVSAVALASLDEPVDCDVLVCGNSGKAKESIRPLVETIAGARFVDAGMLDRARIIEPIAALLIGLNQRYKTSHAGVRITGLPGMPEPLHPPSAPGR
jgi:NADPH-dependent F420 reductase